MERLYKVATKIEITGEEALNYLGHSTDVDYEPTDDEWEQCVDPELSLWAWNTK
jgi:hypothetical protein